MPTVSTSIWARGPKRWVDLALAGAGLLAVAPILGAAGAAVALTSEGGVFFRQARTGRRGEPFEVLKLRTMATTHVHDPNEPMPLTHTDITPVGRVLRRLKIDEMPQLINVLRGDMALIGPRPTVPEQTAQYDAFERQRLLVRPGITGLAQVNGNTALSWPERIEYDVYYVRHHDFVMDVGIVLKTLLVVLRGEDAFARPFEHSPYAGRDPAILEPRAAE